MKSSPRKSTLTIAILTCFTVSSLSSLPAQAQIVSEQEQFLISDLYSNNLVSNIFEEVNNVPAEPDELGIPGRKFSFFKRLNTTPTSFVQSASMVEYALLVALMAVISIIAIRTTGEPIQPEDIDWPY